MKRTDDRQHPVTVRAEADHGDLGKGAYLRRRAAYRLQPDAMRRRLPAADRGAH